MTVEQYWLGIGKLVEEMGEVGQLLGKALVFPAEPHPDGKGTLAERLPIELADLKAAIQYFEQANNLIVDSKRQAEKLVLFNKWGLPGVPDYNAKPYGDEE